MTKLRAVLFSSIFFIVVISGAYAADHFSFQAQAMGYTETTTMPYGGDLRHHMTGHMPYKNWDIWPGANKLKKGKKPHGAFVTIYVNDIALKSIKEKKGMAYGSIVVKENFTPKKDLAAITVMYKFKGFNPGGGDWFWVKYGKEFSILKEGKVKGCVSCHGKVKDNDYIFTDKVTGSGATQGSTPGYK